MATETAQIERPIAVEEVSFYSDGVRIAADVFLPDARTPLPAPAIVVAHGFGGLKKFFVGDIARYFAAQGFVAMTFDYRGFGDSDGPRNRLFPLEQAADVCAAAAYLRTRPEVDGDRIAVYGTSFGGGIAITAAALDTQVRAVVCAVGIADCGRWLRSLRRHWEWLEFERELTEDRTERLLHGHSRVVEPEEIMVRDPASVKHEQYLRENWPDRAFKLDLASADAIIDFKPVDYLPRLGNRALLLIGLRGDGLTPFEETADLYEQMPGIKKLVELGDLSHHDIYQPAHRSGLLETVTEFLVEHLAAPVDHA